MNKNIIGVVGAGVMGRGIVQLFAQAGYPVRCYDAREGAADQALDYARGMIERAVEKGRLDAKILQTGLSMVAADSLADLADCSVVIEAVVEDLDVKRLLFADLEKLLTKDAILATNTSSFTVSEIAAKCTHPERVVGLHFFNPVPLMKVVEVIAAVRTLPAVVQQLKALVEVTGHRAVIAADQPGFLINHAGRGLYTEGLRVLEEQIATSSDIDDILRDGLGFKMGPFELMDLTGLDVSSKVMTSIYEQFQQEPRFRPSALVAPRVAAGLFGRKTGQGWYVYQDGQKQLSALQATPELKQGLRVWVEPSAQHMLELTERIKQSGLLWSAPVLKPSFA